MSQKLFSYVAESRKRGTAFAAFGTRSFPYLADHGFHGMIVLPGTAFVDLALRIQAECLGAAGATVRRIEFFRPVVLGEKDTTLAVQVEQMPDQTVRYVFREKTETQTDATAGPPCAKLEIVRGAGWTEGPASPPVDPAAFMQRATDLGGPDAFYGRLRENGNHYGPCFQGLRKVWRKDQDALGRLRLPLRAPAAFEHQLDPVFLDSVAQLLAGFFIDQDRTFILQGFEQLEMHTRAFPDEVWLHASLRSRSPLPGGSWLGDVTVLDDAGKCLLRAGGVRFTHVARPETSKAETPPSIMVAATFTAEPLEDSLRFWADHLGLPMDVRFAPYNQVFQELLSPDSLLRRNRNGVNVILLNLDDWTNAERPELRLNPDSAAFGNLARHTLPNGIEIAHLNRHETEYVYKEIFEDRCYLRHGIQLPEAATVIDIGANIGLFSLFVRSRSPQASVYSFEPSPVAFRALQANCGAYGPQLHPFNVGVAGQRGSAALTFYEKSSVFSSFHPDAEEDRQAIRTVVANMVRDELKANDDPVDEYVDDLMVDRMSHQTFDCPLVSVSDIVRENALKKIDLLKVDAEKCELEILRGIADEHWPLIDQVVVEVHDRTRRAVGEVQDILARQGFQCAVEEENLLTGSGLFNVYARRSAAAAGPAPDAPPREASEAGIRTKADQFIDALEAYARVVNTPTVVCVCPARDDHASDTAPRWQQIESDLLRRAGALPQVQIVESAGILARYGTAEFHEPDSDKLGHIPYTPLGFAAIGTSVFRALAVRQRAPYKVIVLDCDNTLWQGACGEDGATGVTVTPGHRALQEFMVRQAFAGMLVCLGSKNAAADVWAVFAHNPEMVLKREHLAAARINWSPKSDNLRALAVELNLGLDSFIFLDDNPVECAEVRANCPEVLALELPAEPGKIARFLEHVWAFDQQRATDEDRTRTRKVQENLQRESFRGKVATLKDFIDGLHLTVDIFAPRRDQLDRVAQLTQRTNQFNFTPVRRSAAEVASYLAADGRCLAVTVRDRFGDYGMVGLVCYDVLSDRYRVDTFLLSCRVLGRGVEHQVLAELGRLALAAGRPTVEITYRPTGKNEPAWDFIRSFGMKFMRSPADDAVFDLPSAQIVGLRYDPDHAVPVPAPAEGAAARPAQRPAGPLALDKFQRIAGELGDTPAIGEAIEQFRLRARGFVPGAAGEEAPATLEGRMLHLWRRIIGNPRIGRNDNFFDAGGTSLKAVQTIAAIRRELGISLSIIDLFARPTAGLLCAGREPGGADAGSGSGAAKERGARRKQHGARRRGTPTGATLATA
jgi:FkbH-like protein/FkbM family methyltransferase